MQSVCGSRDPINLTINSSTLPACIRDVIKIVLIAVLIYKIVKREKPTNRTKLRDTSIGYVHYVKWRISTACISKPKHLFSGLKVLKLNIYIDVFDLSTLLHLVSIEIHNFKRPADYIDFNRGVRCVYIACFSSSYAGNCKQYHGY